MDLFKNPALSNILFGTISSPLMYLLISLTVSLLSGEIFNQRSRKLIIRDLKGSTIVLTVGSLINGGILALLFNWKTSKLHDEDPSWLDFVKIPAVLAISDLVFYAGHRLLHVKPMYRLFHKHHHRSVPATSFASLSLGLVDYLIEGPLTTFLPAFLVKMNHKVYYLTAIFNLIWACYVHNSSHHNLGSILCSSKKHQIHHSRGLKNTNFGLYTCIWDHLFNTYRD